MADRIIHTADLNRIENSLSTIHSNLSYLESNMETMDSNLNILQSELETLADSFQSFVDLQAKENRLGRAETRLVQIRQEIEKKYGHYEKVRKIAVGILQANDLGIVKKETITMLSEEMMLMTPGYWLTPCLIALSAWINDNPSLSSKALQEGIRRNDEKTSLFFALVCRRANRLSTSLKWLQRYLENQDEEKLNRETTIVLDAFTSGLLGNDSEGIVYKQFQRWIDTLSEKIGFLETQKKQWSDAIQLKKPIFADDTYPHLKKYSRTFPVVKDIMSGAMLHQPLHQYFLNIFQKESSLEAVKKQLDSVLSTLVEEYDEEELPFRKKERFEQLIVDFSGNEEIAQQHMNIEERSFDTHKDFTQLLTDAAMNSNTSHSSVSTQKFAIALSKDWIIEAYNDIVAANRMKIPYEIEINLDTFNDKTTDGSNEEELLEKFNSLIDQEKEEMLSQYRLTAFDQFLFPSGVAVSVIGAFMALSKSPWLGVIAIIAGVAMVLNNRTKKEQIEKSKEEVRNQFEEKRSSGVIILRAILAEVVDFRDDFKNLDAGSEEVLDFLYQIEAEQYVKKLTNTNRRVRI